LTFRSHHEIFIRRSWYSVLPSLDATISCRIKKAVVGLCIASQCTNHTGLALCIDTSFEFCTFKIVYQNKVNLLRSLVAD